MSDEFHIVCSDAAGECFQGRSLGPVTGDLQTHPRNALRRAHQVGNSLLCRKASEVEDWCLAVRLVWRAFGHTLEVGKEVDPCRIQTIFDELPFNELAGREKAVYAVCVGMNPVVEIGLGGEDH